MYCFLQRFASAFCVRVRVESAYKFFASQIGSWMRLATSFWLSLRCRCGQPLSSPLSGNINLRTWTGARLFQSNCRTSLILEVVAGAQSHQRGQHVRRFVSTVPHDDLVPVEDDTGWRSLESSDLDTTRSTTRTSRRESDDAAVNRCAKEVKNKCAVPMNDASAFITEFLPSSEPYVSHHPFMEEEDDMPKFALVSFFSANGRTGGLDICF